MHHRSAPICGCFPVRLPCPNRPFRLTPPTPAGRLTPTRIRLENPLPSSPCPKTSSSTASLPSPPSPSTVPTSATPSATGCGANWPGSCRTSTPTAPPAPSSSPGPADQAFSAGADIADFDEYRSDSTRGRLYNRAVDGLLEALTLCETPVISMIRGFAAGGGCEIATATDLRIASDNARMGIPVARLGITVGHREMRGLMDLVGKGNALYILLSGRLLDASEALRIGLVNEVVPTTSWSPAPTNWQTKSPASHPCPTPSTSGP